MADMIPKVRDRRFRWQADTDFVGADGYFFKSRNIDTYSNPKYFKLSPKPITAYDMTAVTQFDWVITIFTKNAKILNISTPVSSSAYIHVNWAYAASIWSCATIYKAIEFQDFIFFSYLRVWFEFATTETVHYGIIQIDPATWWVTGVYNPLEWKVEDFWTYNVELHNFNDALLLFAVGSKIRAVKRPLLTNPTWPVYPCDSITPTLQLRKKDNVVAIKQYQEQFKIVCTYWDRDNPQTSCIYIANQADIENGTFTNKIDYPWLNIKWFMTNGSMDYAVCSDWDYIVWWSKPEKLTSRRSFVDFRRETLTLWQYNFITVHIDWDFHLRIYWAWPAWFPDQLSPFVEFSDINSITVWNDQIIVAWTYNWIKWIFYVKDDPNDILQKVDEWSMTFMKFYWNIAWTLKKVEQFTMWYKLPTWTSIAIKMAVNDWSMTTIKTFSWPTYENLTRALLFANDMNTNTLEWWRMQLEVDLTSSSSNRVLTPWVMDILMLYTDIIKWR